MRKFTSVTVLSLFGLFALAVILAVAPFISFDNKSYKKIAEDAAAMYGLDINNYELKFQNTVINAKGESVQGLYRATVTTTEEEVREEKEEIFIKTSWSRPMVIATIFHELAHAAQREHNMDFDDLTIEQHAEVLSFDTMWNSKYAYNAVHLLYLHAVGAKPVSYTATGQLWNVMIGK